MSSKFESFLIRTWQRLRRGGAMWMDAKAAVQWLKDQGYDQANIGLLGASLGCSIAIDAARRADGLTKVCMLAPGVGCLVSTPRST